MSSTPRSRSRSKRSTTNLSNLRLAPLSEKFTADNSTAPAVKTPGSETPSSDATFTRQHPSYLQGKSAPTTPGILSRSSSRKHLVGGGLSRKNSLYNNDDNDNEEEEYTYGGARDPRRRRSSADSGTTLPKAKSEATLLKPSHHSPTRRYKYPSRRPRTGASTPLLNTSDESWLSHAGATASALVQEGKGQSWLSAREVVKPPAESEEDEDDDQYEEMAKLSASTAQLHFAPFEGGSPVSTRVSRWGSRYGSRNTSRRTSRRGSVDPTGMKTPNLRTPGMRTPRVVGDVAPGYFDEMNVEDGREEESGSEIEGLGDGTFGLGPLVDRLMNFNPFKVDDGTETTDDESRDGNETQDEALRRRDLELQRRRDAKAKLVAQPNPAPTGGENGEGEVGGWNDAAWLLSVAAKAMF